MSAHDPTRRRVITILAAGIATAAAGPALASPPARTFRWDGTALGADASLILCHDDPGAAMRAIRACLAEIERLEKEFSLYRDDSAITRLNRDGHLQRPGLEMTSLLRAAIQMAEITDGRFDPTVQPLWRAASAPDPSPAELHRARALVDYRQIAISAVEIRLGAGQAITLNGIAQGYITDRVAELLHARGWRNVLINLGESRALGRNAAGEPWQIALPGTHRESDSDDTLSMTSGALAVSSGATSQLVDTTAGVASTSAETVAVRAPTATTADGLSTALAFVPIDRWAALLRDAGAEEAWWLPAASDNAVIQHVIAARRRG